MKSKNTRIRLFALIILTTAFTGHIAAQDTVAVKETMLRSGYSKEVFHVLASDLKVWHGRFTYFYKDVLLIQGDYFQDMMDGEWTYFYSSGKIRTRVSYSKGVFVKVFETNGEYGDLPGYCLPEFPGGETSMLKYLQANILYPAPEKQKGISGMVKASFVVNTDGIIEDIKIISGVKDGINLEKEAVRIIRMMPRWIPGLIEGKPSRMTYTFPLTFALH